MKKQEDIAGRIRKELAAYLKKDIEEVQPEQALRNDLGLDSMGTIELLYQIEEAFDMQIPDDDLIGLVTVGDVIGYVESRLASPPASPAKPPAKKTAKKGNAASPGSKKKR